MFNMLGIDDNFSRGYLRHRMTSNAMPVYDDTSIVSIERIIANYHARCVTDERFEQTLLSAVHEL